MKKTYTEGKYTLIHERFIDLMGFEKDLFEITWIDEKGIMHHRPFIGDIKVNAKSRDFPINKIPHNYTTKDYKDMLEEQLGNNYLKTNNS